MPRVYERKFDWDEAQRLHRNGVSLSELGRRFGVSPSAVKFAVDQKARERAREYKRQWQMTTCESCGGPALKLVAGKKVHNRDGRILCLRCRADERRERLRFDEHGALAAVRCHSIDCANGDRWQPPENFGRGTRHREVRDGGIAGSCRTCQTRDRQRYRERHKIPCVKCGAPRLPANESGTTAKGLTDSGLCLSCYQASRRKDDERTGVAA